MWGQPHHLRRSAELAYEVTRFFAAGGSGVNYYMWHGGTNFARDAMYLATTSYDFSAPLDEYGLPTDKSETLARLHRFLSDHQQFLLEGERGEIEILVPGAQSASAPPPDEERLEGGRGDQQAAVEEALRDETNGVVLYPLRYGERELVFVINATRSAQQVSVRGVREELPARSALALIGTAGTQPLPPAPSPRGKGEHADRNHETGWNSQQSVSPLPSRGGGWGERLSAADAYTIAYRSWLAPETPIVRVMLPAEVMLNWETIDEPVPARGADAQRRFTPVTLPDNMLLHTRDETDFGWYRTTLESPAARTVTLSAGVADFLAAWVNGRYVGTTPETLKEDRTQRADFHQQLELPLHAGSNELLLLVSALGMVKGDWMLDAPMSEERKGLLTPVLLDGTALAGPWEFSPATWGERVQLPQPGPASLAPWHAVTPGESPLRWYRASFTLSAAQLADPRPWALEIGSLFKGTLWLNGAGLGRYWQQPSPPDAGDEWGRTDFIVTQAAGQPPQHYYHIPADWLCTGENTLIILEERGAQPEGCRLVRRQ